MDLARSEGRRPRPNFGFSKNLGAVSLSHSRLVPMRCVGRMSPIPWNRIVRGETGTGIVLFGDRVRTRRDVAL